MATSEHKNNFFRDVFPKNGWGLKWFVTIIYLVGHLMCSMFEVLVHFICSMKSLYVQYEGSVSAV